MQPLCLPVMLGRERSGDETFPRVHSALKVLPHGEDAAAARDTSSLLVSGPARGLRAPAPAPSGGPSSPS